MPTRLNLFAELTGLPLHVLGPRRPESGQSERPLVLCPTARQLLGVGAELPTLCKRCVAQQWHETALQAKDGQRFAGACASANLCFGLTVADLGRLALVLQARIRNGAGKGGEWPRSLAQNSVCTRLGFPGPRVSAEAYRRAEALLRVMVEGLRAEVRAGRLEQDLTSAHQRLEKLEPTYAGSLNASRPLAPGGRADELLRQVRGRSRKVVAAMLEYLHVHCRQPMSLKELAAHLDMNANYLSELFRQTMGMTFHDYLEAKRMAQAKELLRDPRASIGQVARAVGYGSPNHFRKVFRASEGMSPSEWVALLPQAGPMQTH